MKKMQTQIREKNSTTAVTNLGRSHLLQRKCRCGESADMTRECEECGSKELKVQRRAANQGEPLTIPPVVREILSAPGQALDALTRAFMEQRFGHNFGQMRVHDALPQIAQSRLVVGPAGDCYEQEAERAANTIMREPWLGAAPDSERHGMHDFSGVRIHTDARAAESARSVGALAYTVGRDVVFAEGRFKPETIEGKRLIAHELTHVLQQGAPMTDRAPTSVSGGHVMQRQLGPDAPDPMDNPRMHPPGAPKATTCSPPSWCPKTFCEPYDNESYAKHMRMKMLPVLMAGIAIAVDSRVVPLWHEHLLGGSPQKDLTSKFGKDFTNSKTTQATTDFLVAELKKSLTASPPPIPAATKKTTINIASRIGPAIAEINTPGGLHEMNFNIPNEVPGNLAGGIGTDQLTCKAGAKPSPFNDERKAKGTATVTQDSTGDLSVSPSITYTVKDTIDLCPGDCGTSLEQIATVPISQFEATGISGDVPFTIEFPAIAPSFTIPAAKPAAPSKKTTTTPSPKKTGGGPP